MRSILRWNGVLLLNFTLLSTMLFSTPKLFYTFIYHILTCDLQLIDSRRKLNKNIYVKKMIDQLPLFFFPRERVRALNSKERKISQIFYS